MSFFTELQKKTDNTPVENIIIDFIIKNPNEVIEMTMEEFAEATYSSRSTIFRFCRKHEFKGFNELKTQIAIELNLYLKDFQVRADNLPFSLGDDPVDVIDNVMNSSLFSINQTINTNVENTLIKVAKKLSKAQNIVFIGVEFSGIVAKDACMHFAKIGKSCHSYTDGFEIVNYAKYAKSTDLVFFISYSGSTKFIIEAAQLVKQKNATMVSLTNSSKNVLVELCPLNLYVSSNDSPENNLSLTSRLSTLCVMDVLYCLVLNAEKDTIANYLAHNNDLYGRIFELKTETDNND